MIRFPYLFFAVLTLSACSASPLDVGGNDVDSGASVDGWRCDNRALDSTCVDYPNGATSSDVQGSCDGSLSTGRCPRDKTDGAVGVCDAPAERGPLVGKVLSAVYYDKGARPQTIETARATCAKLGGTFTAP
jgi:hypothetical protein